MDYTSSRLALLPACRQAGLTLVLLPQYCGTGVASALGWDWMFEK